MGVALIAPTGWTFSDVYDPANNCLSPDEVLPKAGVDTLEVARGDARFD